METRIKDESAIINFNLNSNISNKELDMSKMRIGLVKVDWVKGVVEFIGKDIRLWGSYKKVSGESELVPGSYCLENIINSSVTTFECMLAPEDAARLNDTGYIEKINNPSDGESFIFAMEPEWYDGSAAEFIVVQTGIKVLTINNFAEGSVVRYLFTASDEKATRVVTSKIVLPFDCESIIFCTLYKEPIKEVILDDESLGGGVEFDEVINN